ncbi:hypothetical protein ABT382_26435 [Streptomyces pharetrae]|uniref:hypothetical protein n=1 Tax=Streptomyces pharetrae TaxID=291370 RepID=UPI003362DCD3
MDIIRKMATTLGCVTLAASGVFLTAPAAQADTHGRFIVLGEYAFANPEYAFAAPPND